MLIRSMAKATTLLLFSYKKNILSHLKHVAQNKSGITNWFDLLPFIGSW